MKVWILTYYEAPDFPFKGGIVVHGIYRKFRTAEAQKETLMRKFGDRKKNFIIQRMEVE